MLSKEQKVQLYAMAVRYYEGIMRTSKIDNDTALAYMARYKAAMEQVLQRQGKR